MVRLATRTTARSFAACPRSPHRRPRRPPRLRLTTRGTALSMPAARAPPPRKPSRSGPSPSARPRSATWIRRRAPGLPVARGLPAAPGLPVASARGRPGRSGRGGRGGRARDAAERGPQADVADAAAGQGHAHRPGARQRRGPVRPQRLAAPRRAAQVTTGQYEIVDLGSHNGTFVNGQRVTKQVLTEQDLVSIGNSTFRLTGGELRQFVDDGNITFTAQELVVKAGSKVLLDHVIVPDPGKVPARRHRPQRRGQVHPARRADRDASRDHRHGAVRQP